MRILIVDDESAISDTLAYALQADGFASDCCTLGAEALARLDAGDHDLVVLDVGLPDMSGFDVCRVLRRRSDVPVIFLTARSDEVDRIVGLELGADDYVTKPFQLKPLMARVRAVIRKIEPHDSVERYSALGVEVLQGRARIVDPWTVEVALNEGGTRRLSTRSIVIATGARPTVPDLPGLEAVGYLTSDTVWDWDIKSDRIIYNEGITRMFGYDMRKIENTTGWWKQNVHPDDQLTVYEQRQSH